MGKLVGSIYITILAVILTACTQIKNDRHTTGRYYAEEELKSALTDTTEENLINNKTILINDSVTAVNIAEPILFSIYGKENIISERPYETYLINNYWVITGSLPDGYEGGTFLIIIDARNGKIIKIIHGK